jgi:hypothetical protein
MNLLNPNGTGFIIGQAEGHLDGIATLGARKDTFRHRVATFSKSVE